MSADRDFSVLGKSLPRSEDRRFLTGRGRYVGDIEVAGALHVVFVRSPHGHARFKASTASAAPAMPGVVAVWTGVDVAAAATTARVAPPIEGLKPVDLPPFPVDRVRFVGDLVAAVVADTLAHALDAAEAVVVDYRAVARRHQHRRRPCARCGQRRHEVPGNHISHQDVLGRRCRRPLRFSRPDRLRRASRSTARRTCRSSRAAASPIGTPVGSI